MAAFLKRSVKYAAFLYPNGTSGGRINIYCEEENRLYILFSNAGDALPGNSYQGTTGRAYERIDCYPYYVDLLRNESPVWVTFNTDARSFVVYASSEPVGEGEI